MHFSGVGKKGDTGASAYQAWLAQGNSGTQAQFVAALKGAKGDKGDTGNGGASAYQTWLAQGNAGSEAQFVAALKGAKGDTGTAGAKGDKGDTGNAGGKGDKGDTGNAGAAGASAYQTWLAQGSVGTEAEFIAALKGAKGDKGEKGDPGTGSGTGGEKGDKGDPGASAYQTWLAQGNAGTEAQFIAALKGVKGDTGTAGAKGDKGDTGTAGAKGDTGTAGAAGTSAYQTWLAQGNAGTEAQFIAALKGAKGDTGTAGAKGDTGNAGAAGTSAYQTWLAQGNSGTEAQFIATLKGVKGDTGNTGNTGATGTSAYQSWLAQGNSGTEAQFVAALKGLKGDTGNAGAKGDTGNAGAAGASAYQTWLAQGNSGTEAQFIAALKGVKGDTGTAGAKGDKGDTGNTGAAGTSAYQSWLTQGNSGTEAQFVAALKGVKGDTGTAGAKGDTGTAGAKGDTGNTGAAGASAYQTWLAQGNAGTEAQFIAALKGVKGDTGTAGAKGDKGDQGIQGIQGIQGVKGDKGDPGTGSGSGASNADALSVNALNGGAARMQQSKNRERISVYDFGAVGTGRTDKNPLRNRFSTLALCQAVFPFATSLDDQQDWAALQSMMNYMKTQGGRLCTLAGAKLNINRPVILETYYDIDFEGGEIGLQDQAAGRVFDGWTANLNYPSNTNPAVLDGCAFYIINTPYYSKMRNGSFWDGRFAVCFYGTPNTPIFINMEFNYTQCGVMYYNGCQNPRYYNCGGVVLGVLHVSSATCFPAGAPGAGDDFYFSDNVKLHNELGFSSFGAGSYPQFDAWFIASILRPTVPSLAYQQPNQTYNDRNGNVITDPFWLNPTGSLVFMPFRNGRDCFGLYMHGLDIRGAFKFGYARVNTQIRDIHIEQCQYEQLVEQLVTPTTPIYLSAGAVVAGKVGHVNQLDYIDGAHPLFGYSGRGKSDGYETDVAWYRENTTEVTARFGRMHDRGYMKGKHYIVDEVIPFADNQLHAQGNTADSAAAEATLDLRGKYMQDWYLKTLVESVPGQFFLPSVAKDGKVRTDLQLDMLPSVGQVEVVVWNQTRGEFDFAVYQVDTAVSQTLTLSQALNNGDTIVRFNQSINDNYDSPRFAWFQVQGQSYGFMSDGADGSTIRPLGDGNRVRGLPAGGLPVGTTIVRSQALIPRIEFKRGWAAVVTTNTANVDFGLDGNAPGQAPGTLAIRNLTGTYAAPNSCDMLMIQVRFRQIPNVAGDLYRAAAPTSGMWRVGTIVKRTLSGTSPVLEWQCVTGGAAVQGSFICVRGEFRSGTTTQKNALALTLNDKGYGYWDTTLGRMSYWSGTAWL